jgi:hypothetical protein
VIWACRKKKKKSLAFSTKKNKKREGNGAEPQLGIRESGVCLASVGIASSR